MAFKKVAEISIDKLEDRKTVTAILHANGYTVGPGKRKKTPTGKQLDYSSASSQFRKKLFIDNSTVTSLADASYFFTHFTSASFSARRLLF